jgi:YkoP domain
MAPAPGSASEVGVDTDADMNGQRRHGSSRLRQLVRGMDFVSRKLLGIIEFDSSEDCLLRIALHHADREIGLAESALIRAGDTVMELHLWNEHLRVPESGPDLRWAATSRRRFDRSLQRVAAHLETDPKFGAVRAVMIAPALTGRQQRKDRRYMRYLLRADWSAVPRRTGALRRLHQLIDDFWLWLLGRAFNPRNTKSTGFLRHREEFWIARERFLALYRAPRGGGSLPSAKAALAIPAGGAGDRERKT